MRPEQRVIGGIVFAVVVLLVGSIVYHVVESEKCEDKGGVYVRGAFGMKCVQEVKPKP